MLSTLLNENIYEVIEFRHSLPAVSIILPFNPKMGGKPGITQSLQCAALKVKKVLEQQYPGDLSLLVLHKLENIIHNLNFNTHKRSIAIYVSPVFEKVLYLDITVTEQVTVADSFEIRDLVYSKKKEQQYLLLALTEETAHTYLGNASSLAQVALLSSKSICTCVEDTAGFSGASNESDPAESRFLNYIDNSLGIILDSYPLPLFVTGTEKLTAHFANVTKHGAAIVDYIHGNYSGYETELLKSMLLPYLKNWEIIEDRDLHNQLNAALSCNRLTTGIQQVKRDAAQQKGRLLVVEKGYAGEHEENNVLRPYSYIKDAVDAVMEKVLENGGDVTFVEPGTLNAYDHIALVQYY